MAINGLRRGLLLLLVVALMAIIPVTAFAQTEGDVKRAEDQVDRAKGSTSAAYTRWQQAQDDLEAALLELDRVTSQIENVEYTIGLLESKISSYEDDVVTLRTTAQKLVLEAYTSGGRGMVTAAFEAGSIQDLLTSRELMNSAASRDIADLDRLQAVSRETDRLKVEMKDKKAELETLQQQAQSYADRADALADEAQATYNAASAAEKRAIDNLAKERHELQAAIALKKAREAAAAAAAAQARADAASSANSSSSSGSSSSSTSSSSSSSSSSSNSDSSSSSSSSSGTSSSPPTTQPPAPAATAGFNCPVLGGASFIDSWGFPRSGGRRHKGVDMFNKRNTPLVAVVDGKVKFSSNSLGGLSTHLYASDGTVYYYAHLQKHPTNISSGSFVKAGTIVGYLGNSGNARYTSPHLHFEIRPGGVAVNPYPTVRRYCP